MAGSAKLLGGGGVQKLPINLEEFLLRAHGNFQEQISFCIFHKLLLIIALLLLMHIIIIYSMYIVNNIFLTKASAKNAVRKKTWQ